MAKKAVAAVETAENGPSVDPGVLIPADKPELWQPVPMVRAGAAGAGLGARSGAGLEYEAFLATKSLRHIATGVTVSDGDIHESLFPFQRDLTRWGLGKGRGAIFADTGLGKTRMGCEWSRLCGGRVLALAPLGVALQTVEEAQKIGFPLVYARKQEDAGQFTITNYEMLPHFDASQFGAVWLDECFAGDTPVFVLEDGECGWKHIKDVRIGDKIINVAGVDTVADVHRREVEYAVQIWCCDRPITCSPNHPFFTQRGWIGAQDLEPGDSIMETLAAMRLVLEGDGAEIQRAEVLRSILLSEMADEHPRASSEGAYARGGSETREVSKSLPRIWNPESISGDRAYQASLPFHAAGSQGEDLPPIERDEPRTFRAWGQRDWVDGASTDTSGCARRELASGISFVTGEANSRLSDALQARHRQRQSESGYRSGWSLPCEPKGQGHQEGREAGFARVESLEVLKSGHPELERLRDSDGRIYLYDLGATLHPSYSVGGLLAHNSSILKAMDGKTRKMLTETFAGTRMKLCTTATPAPNDIAEIANHAEFLGIMTRVEMLATFFVHDDEGWRLKGHAREAFYKWMASWGMSLKRPSDLGYSDEGYILPKLSVIPHFIESDACPEGQLFAFGVKGITDRSRMRKATLEDRVKHAVSLVQAEPDEPWLLWCGLNNEQDAIAKALGDKCVSIYGSLSMDEKVNRLHAWIRGEVPYCVSKISILGFGLNLQHCARQGFVGLGDSWEQFYQGVRRCWRFGQKREVHAHIVLSEAEQAIFSNVMRKEAEAEKMAAELIKHVAEFELSEIRTSQGKVDYLPAMPMRVPGWLTCDRMDV